MTNDEFDDMRPPIDERDIDRETQREALRNWIRKLQSETLAPLTFDRESHQYDMFAQIGLIGKAALCNVGIEEAAELAYWEHPFDTVPSGSDFGRYLKRIRTDGFGTAPAARHLPTLAYCRINKQFDAVNRRLLDIAHDAGLFEGATRLAVDAYQVDYFSKGHDLTITCSPKPENDVTQQFWFLILSVIDNDASFIIGTRMLPEVAAVPKATKGLLSLLPDYIDIDLILADAGHSSTAFINRLREHAGRNWVMSAVERDIMKQLGRVTPKDHVGYVEKTLKDIDRSPHGIAYPIPDDEDENETAGTGAPPVFKFTQRQLDAENPLDAIDQNADLAQLALTDPNADDDTDISTHPGQNDGSGTDGPLRAKSGVGQDETHATYLTDLSLSAYPPSYIRSEYLDRWAIETRVRQLKHRFRPEIEADRGDKRLYFAHVATVFHNWHALISRVPSPRWGVPMPNVTGADVLKAVEAVAFGED